MSSSSIRKLHAFWEKAHSHKNLKYLSGNPLKKVVDYFNLEEILSTPKRILCVGVGDCEWMKELQVQGHILDAFDISKKGIIHAKQFCDKVYDLRSIKKVRLDFYDLVISFFVAQHLENEELDWHFKYIIPALKLNTGIFALHYDEPLDGQKDYPIVRKFFPGNIIRSRQTIIDMLSIYRAKILAIVHKMQLVVYNKTQMGIFIGRYDNEDDA